MKFGDLIYFSEKQKNGKSGYVVDWEKVLSIPEFVALEETKQSEKWHKEGNVLNHTRLVVAAMEEQMEYIKNRSDSFYLIMMVAALCHDLGKAITTKLDFRTGDYVCNHHGLASERITRTLFYDEDVIDREIVCYIVRYHMTLHHILDNKEKIDKKIITLFQGLAPLEDMLLLNLCDSIGSYSDEETLADVYKKHDEIRRRANELAPYKRFAFFNNTAERLKYFRGLVGLPTIETLWIKEYRKEFEMIIMIGIPGSGKDTLISKCYKNFPVLCRDTIRTEIGIKGEKPFGDSEQEAEVTRIFKERLIGLCEERKSFVVNNTNIHKRHRHELLDMVVDYGPTIIYVYVNPPSVEECKRRREGQMPMSVIDKMWNEMEFPNLTECDFLFIDDQRENRIVRLDSSLIT